MKKTYLFIIMMMMSLHVAAFDDNDYKKYCQEVKQQIWSMDLPQFKTRKAPEKYKKESAVILAKYEDYSIDQKRKLNLVSSTGVSKDIISVHFIRNMVLIQDQAALKEYSEFEYQTYQRKFYNDFGRDDHRNVLGVRVIKPDGSIHEVSSDDYTDAGDKKTKEKKAKLAVPDLKVGDIIDFFLYNANKVKEENVDPEPFPFIFNHPVLDYKVHCSIDPKFNIRYRTLNGAPEFKDSKDGDGNILLDLEQKNLDKVEPDYAFSRIEQAPMILLYAVTSAAYGGQTRNTREKGLFANPPAEKSQEDAWYQCKGYYFMGFHPAIKEAIKKCKTMDSEEEKADYLYKLVLTITMAKREYQVNPGEFNDYFEALLKKAGIKEVDHIITTDCMSEKLDQLMDPGNVTVVLRLKSGRMYFPITALNTGVKDIPEMFQGRQAKATSAQKKMKDGPFEDLTFAESKAADNVESTECKLTIDGTNLNVERTMTFTGVEKEGKVATYSTSEEIAKNWGKAYDITSLSDLFSGKNAIAEADELEEAVKKKVEEQFKNEIKAYHDKEPIAITSKKVLSFGEDEKPYSYQVAYQEDGMVKKAGPNLLVSIGKMMGQQAHIEGRERSREFDVIRPSANTLHYQITLNIPAGYNVPAESLKKLNSKVDNVAGSFITSAQVKGKELIVNIDKVYKHRKEALANWPLLLKVLDAAYDFTSMQVVLKK